MYCLLVIACVCLCVCVCVSVPCGGGAADGGGGPHGVRDEAGEAARGDLQVQEIKGVLLLQYGSINFNSRV